MKQSFRLLQHPNDAGQKSCRFNAVYDSVVAGEIKRNDRFGIEFRPVTDRLDRHSRDARDRGLRQVDDRREAGPRFPPNI